MLKTSAKGRATSLLRSILGLLSVAKLSSSEQMKRAPGAICIPLVALAVAFAGVRPALADLPQRIVISVDINRAAFAYSMGDKHEPRVSPRTLPEPKTDGPARRHFLRRGASVYPCRPETL